MTMNKFKEKWEIKKNWQLLFPFLGVLALLYCSYRIASIFFDRTDTSKLFYLIVLSFILYFVFLKISLWLFKKLENRWIVKYKWEMIRIFLVFAFTGTSSVFVGKPIIKLLGISQDSMNPILYWFLYIFIGLVFYQILLLFFGWLLGQFQFFWDFEKKIFKRFGAKRLK